MKHKLEGIYMLLILAVLYFITGGDIIHDYRKAYVTSCAIFPVLECNEYKVMKYHILNKIDDITN